MWSGATFYTLLTRWLLMSPVPSMATTSPFAFARSVAIVASEILARTNIGTKRTNAPMLMMHRWSITFDFWSFEETKNMDQIAWLDPQFRQHNLQVLKITNEKSNTFPFGLMFCFQAPFEFWKSERLDETKNHSWHQLEPVNRKACMKCLNSGPYMKWRSIPWKIPLQNFKISHWWFLWSNLSHPSFNGLVKAPLNPPWGTLGLSSKKVEHELLGSVSPPLFSAFFHPGWTSDLRGGRFNKTVPLWAELGTICDQKQASLAKFFPDSPHGLQRNIADFIHSTSIFIDFHWWSAYPNLGCCVSVINKDSRIPSSRSLWHP